MEVVELCIVKRGELMSKCSAGVMEQRSDEQMSLRCVPCSSSLRLENAPIGKREKHTERVGVTRIIQTVK